MSKSRATETEVTIIPPGKPSHRAKSKSRALAVPASEDALMGEQLTTQYRRAVSGMQEVVIFGAMMIKLREKFPEITKKGPAAKSKSTRGLTLDEPAPITLEKWLNTYAPDVKKPTAYRFLHVTESIAGHYAEIVGAKTAKLISLPDLVTLPAKELPRGCEAKQLQLFEFVNGTSQRSWLDMFSPESPQKRGHKTKVEQGNDKPKPKTTAQLTADAEAEMVTIMGMLRAWFLAGHQNRVSAETREIAVAVLEDAQTKINAVK